MYPISKPLCTPVKSLYYKQHTLYQTWTQQSHFAENFLIFKPTPLNRS
jgi:hypothetical protein